MEFLLQLLVLGSLHLGLMLKRVAFALERFNFFKQLVNAVGKVYWVFYGAFAWNWWRKVCWRWFEGRNSLRDDIGDTDNLRRPAGYGPAFRQIWMPAS